MVDRANKGHNLSALLTSTTRAQSGSRTVVTTPDNAFTSCTLRTIYDNVPLQYGRIRNIRVLRFEGGDVAGHISCELSTISVHGGSLYTAVSYQWGSDIDQKTILVGGTPFKVQQNLWQFLAQMQRASQGTFFWIDAICIQQANVHERNNQVAMMGDVYSNAAKVIVWLGAEEIPLHKHGLLETIRSATLDPNNNARENQLELRECLRQLANNTYWTRAWVLQEFVLGAWIELRCGSGCLQEDIFRHFWTCMYKVQIEPANDLAGEEATRIHAMKRIVGYRIERRKDSLESKVSNKTKARTDRHFGMHKLHSLEYLTEEFAQTRCSNPRDRIYSLLSLVSPDLDQCPIIPDYVKAASDFLTELVGRYCDTYPVFRFYHKGILGFMKSTGMTRSAVELELKRKAYNPRERSPRLQLA